MPLKRGKGSRTAEEKERRVLSAISAVEKDRLSSIRKAARRYQVPIATLRNRLGGPAPNHRKCRQHHELNQDGEDSPAQSDVSLVQQGAAPSLSNARNGQCASHQVSWFDQVQTTVIQHEIAAEDIYNFDETGFAIGPLASTQVVMKSDTVEPASLSQPDNRRWATSMECINSTGVALPPCIVFKGMYHLECWYTETELPGDWSIAVTPNGWATDEIRLYWLKKLFIPFTSRAAGRVRLLIFDQDSYLTPQFRQTCKDNNIIPICPPTYSRIRLPLEAGCLSSLKRAYRRRAENLMRGGSKYIDKLDFLASFLEIHREVYKAENIKDGFSATGMTPLCREKVHFRPNTQLREATPLDCGPHPAEYLRKNLLGKEISVLKQLLREEPETLRLSSSAKAALGRFIKQAEKLERYTQEQLKEYDELRASIQENEERTQAEEEAEEAYQGP
ncbi:transposase [Aspergillus affinis]|uniref:transposase n=1 Tax=Aspergillus affinis TaxID=1070780 RepID=UPI0022FEFCD7|nr:transposase [Aspergillus affinis]KAI9043641.1 transposase [Aspergillus affinis]